MAGYMPQSDRTDWNTPANVIECVRACFGAIELDPCSNKRAKTGALINLGPDWKTDGLAARWYARSVYVNPPFDLLREFAAKAAGEYAAGEAGEIVMLMPSRTDTRAWHDHVATAAAVCFWKGRIRFEGADGPCPFPTAFVYWGRNVARFSRAFKSAGMILRVNGKE